MTSPPPRSRSHSPSRPSSLGDRRDRSRSPIRRRSPQPNPKKHSGFKWKSKPSRDAGGNDERDRDRNRDQDRQRDRERDRGRDDDRSYRPRRYGDDRKARLNEGRDSGRLGQEQEGKARGGPHAPSSKSAAALPKVAPKVAPKPATAPATFIIVTVNDRLGTKASIPCLPSDTVGDFKKLVAAHIGRQPHEIMLKRQGERPFKDIISLEDYGINNGVQLDLELDTGE